jgi:hypothetical protein
VQRVLEFLGKTFHGATAFPKARGVWRDDDRDGQLVFDEPVVIQCYTDRKLIAKNASQLGELLTRMGRETGQGAVGFVVNREYFEIAFALD